MLHEVMSSRTSYNTAWDGVIIDLAISLKFFYSLLSYKFPWISTFSIVVLLF